MACIGMGMSNVSAATNAPGVSDNAVKIGFISAQTGAAASVGKNDAGACKAHVDAQNASGGVNGRKIDLIAIDDQSSAANLTAAKDLVENQKVFTVIDQSPLGFLSYRYLKEAGVPRIGSGTDGSFYGVKGNEDLISSLGNGAPVASFAYDSIEQMMRKMGAKTVAAAGYGSSPGSSNSATSAVKYGAPAVGSSRDTSTRPSSSEPPMSAHWSSASRTRAPTACTSPWRPTRTSRSSKACNRTTWT